MDIAVSIVAGVFSLSGAIIGAMLGRRSDHQRWRREERSAAFSEYLRQLHDVRISCLDLIYCKSGEESSADMKITERFLSLSSQEGIVRLHLNAVDRDEFSASAKALFSATSRDLDQSIRFSESEAALSRIQALFERSLQG